MQGSRLIFIKKLINGSSAYGLKDMEIYLVKTHEQTLATSYIYIYGKKICFKPFTEM